MEFLFYLTPQSQDILNKVYLARYSIRENVEYCLKNQNIFGYADFQKKFVICTKNIKRSGYNVKYYINETVQHEAVHVAHLCNGYKSFGIPLESMPLSANKLQDVKNSVNASTSSVRIEHEAYWMEDKPEKVKYVLQKYCF